MLGLYLGWYPVAPANVKFAYTVLGTSSPTISGSTSICPGTTGTFTINNKPDNVNVIWTCTPTLSITSNGNSATVSNSTTLNSDASLFVPASIGFYPTLIFPPEGWVHAELEGMGITLETLISINTNAIQDFNLPTTAQGNTVLTVDATTTVPAFVNWSVTPATCASWINLSDNRMQITFTRNGLYTVQARITNACGTFLKEKQITISGSVCSTCPCQPVSQNVITFPNPASSEVTIEITDDANNEVPESSFNVNIVDINGAVVYSGQKKGKKFNLSTTSFRNGIYNVIVSDGTTLLRKKLIVKH